MKIEDLAFLDNVSENELILGSAAVSLTSIAAAEGNSATTLVVANTTASPLSAGGNIAIGKVFAIATGDNPTVGVAVAGEGDIVIGVTSSKEIPRLNTTIAFGVVVAIDKPLLKP